MGFLLIFLVLFLVCRPEKRGACIPFAAVLLVFFFLFQSWWHGIPFMRGMGVVPHPPFFPMMPMGGGFFLLLLFACAFLFLTKKEG